MCSPQAVLCGPLWCRREYQERLKRITENTTRAQELKLLEAMNALVSHGAPQTHKPPSPVPRSPTVGRTRSSSVHYHIAGKFHRRKYLYAVIIHMYTCSASTKQPGMFYGNGLLQFALCTGQTTDWEFCQTWTHSHVKPQSHNGTKEVLSVSCSTTAAMYIKVCTYVGR